MRRWHPTKLDAASHPSLQLNLNYAEGAFLLQVQRWMDGRRADSVPTSNNGVYITKSARDRQQRQKETICTTGIPSTYRAILKQ